MKYVMAYLTAVGVMMLFFGALFLCMSVLDGSSPLAAYFLYVSCAAGFAGPIALRLK